MLAPVHDAKIKILTLTEKKKTIKNDTARMTIKSKRNAQCLHLVRVCAGEKVACYVITAKRTSHHFVHEATNNSKNIDARLQHEAKATRRSLNSSGDERHKRTPAIG